MSAFNMTPISILDKGPMGGFRGGLADDRAIQHSNSNLLTESLAQDRQREDLETIRLNRPTDAIKRAAEEAKLEEEMQMRKEGYFREKANLEQESRMQDLIKQKDTNELNRVNREGEAMVRASQHLEAAGENAQNMLYLTANWDAITDPLKQAGMKNIPPPSIEAAQKIMKNSQAWIRSSKFIQEEMISRQKHLQDIDRDLIKSGADAAYRTAENMRHEAWQGGQNDAQRKTMERVAEIGAEGRASGSGNTPKKEEAEAISKVRDFIDNPETKDMPSKNDIQTYLRLRFGKQADRAEQNAEGIMMEANKMALMFSKDPKKKAEFLANAKQQADEMRVSYQNSPEWKEAIAELESAAKRKQQKASTPQSVTTAPSREASGKIRSSTDTVPQTTTVHSQPTPPQGAIGKRVENGKVVEWVLKDGTRIKAQ